MQDLEIKTNSTVLEISDKEVSRMAGRKKFLGNYKCVQFKVPENWIPMFDKLVENDPSLNSNKIIRTALENYFSSLPELRKQKKAS